MIEYFDKQAGTYGTRSERGLWRRFRARESAVLMELLAPHAGQRVLDLGCGAGFYARRLQARGARVLAVDSSPAMLDALSGAGIATHLCEAEDFTSALLFDKVLCAGMLEFTPRAEAVFARVRAALVPGGRFVILIPATGLIGRAYGWAHDCPVYLRDAGEYAALARAAGFQTARLRRCTPISLALEFTLSS